MKKIFRAALMIVSSLMFCNPVFAEDGNYNAVISNNGGIYEGTALVEGEMVTAVKWSEGEEIFDPGLEIVDGTACGLDSDGHPVSVQMQDYY